MKRHVLIIILAFGMSGCATPSKQGDLSFRSAQEWKLSRADALLQEGNASAAVQVLAQICAEPVVPGVTDEALFRLSLLHLGTGLESSGMVQTQNDLERLAKKYTFSTWAPLASRLTRFLASAEEARQQKMKVEELNLSLIKEIGEAKGQIFSLTKEQRKLKQHNRYLLKENKEVREDIEKLKALEKVLGKGDWK